MKDIFMYAFGALITLGMLILIGVLVVKEIPFENKDLLNIVIGAFIGVFVQIGQFFFGSSMGSREKDEKLKKA